MKSVCLFNYAPVDDFYGYRLETFDPLSYFPQGDHWGYTDLITWGLNGFDKRRALTAGAAGIDRLYRERDPNYMRMIDDFVDRFRDFDIIVMSTYNFVHPEVFYKHLKKPVKVLGLIDDPLSTYSRGIPYLWAFDGAFYISPSYLDGQHMQTAMSRWQSIPSRWFPLVPTTYSYPLAADDAFFSDRKIDIVYVGNPSHSKVERLIKFKRHFGSRLRVHGRWPMKGWSGVARGAFGKAVYPYRVTSLTAPERTDLYWSAKIGLNMHVSDTPIETGNVRMYETCAHGLLQVCDKSGSEAHASIFLPNEEAVYYESVEEAIELIEYYLRNDEPRVAIAKRGFERFWRDYNWEGNLKNFLDWCGTLRGV